MLKFGAETARLLDEAYQGRDFTARRRASLDALAPRPGDRILDLGCGNGMLTLELSRAVGPEGMVHGADPSDDMLASARDRCGDRPNVALIQAQADALPVEDASLDGAVSLQVFEYIADIPAALAELRRVLRPGARLVIGDMHFATLAWFSDVPERMDRMCRSWNNHVVDAALPARLPTLLRAAGFGGLTMTPLTFCDTELRADGIAQMMMRLMTAYAVQNGDVEQDEAGAWAAEQQDLARAGRFFFTLTHFVCTATRA